jgi:transcriptional regulator with XRE-family HTH domain
MMIGPTDMWQRIDLRLAFARHDLRTVFQIMHRHGISQRRIAAATDMNQSEISEIIAGKRQIQSYVLLRRVADGLGIPRGWLGLDYDPATKGLLAGPESLKGRRGLRTPPPVSRR